MRRFTNIAAGLIAAGMCALITYLTIDSSFWNIIYNLCFLSVMLIIMIGAAGIGFSRLNETRGGLNRAAKKLSDIAANGGNMSSITAKGAKLFEVPYLDEKYQEYLTYLHKTNSPTDIGDYIGEYEINNYTHRRLVEMVPDILTSLGILGTFVGLVLGLRGFNPNSFEAMSSSVESLIDGIKVAFVTSIYGLSLSLAYSYWLRGTLTSVSSSLDKFLDTYYTTAVPPTDATAMNHVIANQNNQTKLMQQMQKDLAAEVSHTLSSSITPLIEHLDKTMDNFTEVVTANQEQLLENIAGRMAKTIKQEFFSEFLEMRKVLNDSNTVQKNHLEFMAQNEEKFRTDVMRGEQQMSDAMEASADAVREAFSALNEQEQYLRRFVADMQQAMEDIGKTNDLSLKMTGQMDALSEQNGRIAEQMMEVAKLSEQYTRSLAAAQADNSDLAEGLSVMNDANIRMTDQISKINESTAEKLEQSQAAQKEFIDSSMDYLKKIGESQNTLSEQMKTQQENLREFTGYMTQVLQRMAGLTESSGLTLKEVTDRLQELSGEKQLQDNETANACLQRMAALLEMQEKRERIRDANAVKTAEEPKKKGFFRR